MDEDEPDPDDEFVFFPEPDIVMMTSEDYWALMYDLYGPVLN